MLKTATGAMIYFVLYVLQRFWNFLVYERFIDNCLQQFIDVASIANVSVLILINSYGFYIHGRSGVIQQNCIVLYFILNNLFNVVHGRSDIDSFQMLLQFKREEENLCGNRGLCEDQQTFTILAPRNLRLFYEKLISPTCQTTKSSHCHQQFNNNSMKFEHSFEKTILTYHNINRFFAAFIDHVSCTHIGQGVKMPSINQSKKQIICNYLQALKDVDYVIKEKNLFEKLFDCELETTVNNDSKGVFYFDNGHSFDKGKIIKSN